MSLSLKHLFLRSPGHGTCVRSCDFIFIVAPGEYVIVMETSVQTLNGPNLPVQQLEPLIASSILQDENKLHNISVSQFQIQSQTLFIFHFACIIWTHPGSFGLQWDLVWWVEQRCSWWLRKQRQTALLCCQIG